MAAALAVDVAAIKRRDVRLQHRGRELKMFPGIVESRWQTGGFQ